MNCKNCKHLSTQEIKSGLIAYEIIEYCSNNREGNLIKIENLKECPGRVLIKKTPTETAEKTEKNTDIFITKKSINDNTSETTEVSSNAKLLMAAGVILMPYACVWFLDEKKYGPKLTKYGKAYGLFLMPYLFGWFVVLNNKYSKRVRIAVGIWCALICLSTISTILEPIVDPVSYEIEKTKIWQETREKEQRQKDKMNGVFYTKTGSYPVAENLYDLKLAVKVMNDHVALQKLIDSGRVRELRGGVRVYLGERSGIGYVQIRPEGSLGYVWVLRESLEQR